MKILKQALKSNTLPERVKAIGFITDRMLDFSHPEIGPQLLGNTSGGARTISLLIQHLISCVDCLSVSIYGRGNAPARELQKYLTILNEFKFHVDEAIRMQTPVAKSAVTRLIGSYHQYLTRIPNLRATITCSSEYMDVCACVIAIWHV